MEIKFRQFIIGLEITNVKKNIEIKDGKGNWHYWGIFENGFVAPVNYKIKSYQYIGLKDENKKETYSEDIVEFYNGEKAIIEWRIGGHVFKFFSKHGGEGFEYIHNWQMRFKIIGNKFENKNLLNKK